MSTKSAEACACTKASIATTKMSCLASTLMLYLFNGSLKHSLRQRRYYFYLLASSLLLWVVLLIAPLRYLWAWTLWPSEEVSYNATRMGLNLFSIVSIPLIHLESCICGAHHLGSKGIGEMGYRLDGVRISITHLDGSRINKLSWARRGIDIGSRGCDLCPKHHWRRWSTPYLIDLMMML